jgi:asparagine synthase (glutamine-hydrolysing)
MCGITGIIDLAEGQAVDRHHILAMCDWMVHRGPNDEGVYVKGNVGLGNRRLAIIDLSPAGHQPMSNEDSSIWVTLNGEIYNFLELREILRKKGHRFHSDTDTEVVVHAYEEYGVGCLEKLNGMFGLAIWDGKERLLLLARDRVGIKPLYYYFDDRRLLFASEMQALLHSGIRGLSLEIDPFALNQYFVFGDFPAPYTIFKKVRKLLPGHYLILKHGEVETRPYWQVRFQPAQEVDENALLDEFDSLIQESVSKRLISDVPLGAFLSGGIDSTCVVGIASKITNSPLKTFSIGYNDERYDESRYARQVAAYFGTDHHELIIGEEDVSSEDVLRIMGCFDEPFYDHSAIPTYYVSQLAREQVTVVLSGDGGDELFFGYKHLRKLAQEYARRQELLARMKADGQSWYDVLPRSLLEYAYHGYRLLTDHLPDWAARPAFIDSIEYKLYHEPYRDWADYFVKARSRIPRSLRVALLNDDRALDNESLFLREILALEDSSDAVAQLAATDFRNYLPNDILVKVDRMSMQHSLEARVPLLDHTVVEFAARVPTHLKYRAHTQKYLLKRYLESHLILDPEVLALVTREKHGFRFPIGEYIEHRLKDQIQQSLRSKRFQDAFGINPQGVEKALSARYRPLQLRRGGKTIWMLFCLYLWWQNNLER